MRINKCCKIGEGSAEVEVIGATTVEYVDAYNQYTNTESEKQVWGVEVGHVIFQGVDIFDCLTAAQITELQMELQTMREGELA